MSLPKFRLSSLPPTTPVSRVTGKPGGVRVVHAGWLEHGRFGFLKDGRRLHRGRWRRDVEEWTFVFTARDGVILDRETRELEFLDDHWGSRAALVFDPARSWTPRHYRACRGREWQSCAICDGPISEEHPEHVRSEPNTLACASCHERFIVARSLAFVPGMPARDPEAMPPRSIELEPLVETELVSASEAGAVGAAA